MNNLLTKLFLSCLIVNCFGCAKENVEPVIVEKKNKQFDFWNKKGDIVLFQKTPIAINMRGFYWNKLILPAPSEWKNVSKSIKIDSSTSLIDVVSDLGLGSYSRDSSGKIELIYWAVNPKQIYIAYAPFKNRNGSVYCSEFVSTENPNLVGPRSLKVSSVSVPKKK